VSYGGPSGGGDFLLARCPCTLVAGPRRSLSLEVSDTRIYEPYVRSRLGITAPFCQVVLAELFPLGYSSRRGRSWCNPISHSSSLSHSFFHAFSCSRFLALSLCLSFSPLFYLSLALSFTHARVRALTSSSRAGFAEKPSALLRSCLSMCRGTLPTRKRVYP